MYTANKLIELLEKQQESRGKATLFKKEKFTIQWRAKVGSYPHPDGETIISAGEPCGNWKHDNQKKLNVGQNYNEFPELPINGYIPGSSIRGLVRAWVRKYPNNSQQLKDKLGYNKEELIKKVNELLGYQDDEKIIPGKIEFLDAYPDKPTRLTLDIVNPQQDFQVLHEGQSKPLSFYTLGDGNNKIKVTIAIRGIPNKATEEDVEKVWKWVEQALHFHGVGSRTASGYGMIKSQNKPKAIRSENEISKVFDFTLYSQGCYGANQNNRDDVQLRPSHWRGWLRSWFLRFLLGVMSKENAEKILGELLGSIDENSGKSYKGCVRLELIKNQPWGEVSEDEPDFYTWKGKLKITAPKDILNEIILPIIKFACSVGGVGRGWRRPLHIFSFNNGKKATRGCYLKLSHKVKSKQTGDVKTIGYQLSPNKPEIWVKTYDQWLKAIKSYGGDKITIDTTINNNLKAEVFSPHTCAIYAVPGPDKNPIDESYQSWQNIRGNEETRGEGMTLIYQSKYKKKTQVGGDAGNGNKAYCSWVSIRRVNVPNKIAQTQCQEIVCLFMGGQPAIIDDDKNNNLRSQFLKELSNIPNSTLLFGVSPDNHN